VELLLIVEPIVIERQNYLKIKEHLKYLEEVLQLNPASEIGRASCRERV